MEEVRSRAKSADTQAAEREAELKERLGQMEERLVRLTAPEDDAEGVERSHADEAGLPDDATQPGAATARCMTLLVEASYSFRCRFHAV